MTYLNICLGKRNKQKNGDKAVARCSICNDTHRKTKGESWEKAMCKGCYRLTDHFTWAGRFDFSTTYLRHEDILPTETKGLNITIP